MPPRPSISAARQSRDAVVSRRKWLLFVHHLPAKGSNLRVRTWRRLQQIGAIPVKQAVYALPDTPNGREDFEWLKAEVVGQGGEAAVFSADTVDSWTDDELVEEFRRARQSSYDELAGDVERALTRVGARVRPGRRAPAARRLLELFRQRLEAVERVDLFGSAGRDRVRTLLAQLETRVSAGRSNGPAAAVVAGSQRREAYRGGIWVTRPRPGVDRMASAWLIRRFIDPGARFAFARDREAVTEDAIAFDMFGVEFTHRGQQCTFETLCAVFDVRDEAVQHLAAIVHDLDLKDGRFSASEAPAIGMVIDGLQLAYADDQELLAQGIVLFDALYRAAERATHPARPRPVASQRPRTRPTTSKKRR